MNLELRYATSEDMSAIMDIFADARQFQQQLGFRQWTDGYPRKEIIEADMNLSRGFMIMLDGAVAGYCVVDCHGEKEYDSRRHIWTTAAPYAAVHRVAFGSGARGRRLGAELFRRIEEYAMSEGISVLKVDTGVENIPMRRLLVSAGFRDCGKQMFSWGPRIAFEKRIAEMPERF